MEKGAGVTAIELQGIVRNQTKIGAQDGQAEDILNLRFKDGSWRTSGDGRLVYTDSVGYEQLYIHTNEYRHLLGVRNGKLWWFANIDTDGVTFESLSSPDALTEVTGNIWITQTGHSITIIDEADNFEYFVYHLNEGKYVQVKVDENGEQTDRGLFPFGQVHFNYINSGEYVEYLSNLPEPIAGSYWFDENFDINQRVVEAEFNPQTMHDTMVSMFAKASKNNHFTRPLLAVAALRLYDGSYMYSSNPTLIFPSEGAYRAKRIFGNKMTTWDEAGVGIYGSMIKEISDTISAIDSQVQVTQETRPAAEEYWCIPQCAHFFSVEPATYAEVIKVDTYVGGGSADTEHHNQSINNSFYKAVNKPIFSAGMRVNENLYPSTSEPHRVCPTASLNYYDLCLSINPDILNFLNNNPLTIKSICIFVTKEVDIYNMSSEGEDNLGCIIYKYRSVGNDACGFYRPNLRTEEQIIYDLKNSPFFLLREYDKGDIPNLLVNPTISLSEPEYEGLIENIVQQDRLPIESTSRLTYLPKYSYSYNGRLHIANYKTRQFHGYPLDLFHLHNHSVKVEVGSYFKGVLKNLVSDNDAYLQYPHTNYNFPAIYPSDLKAFAVVRVAIEVDDGTQKVVRYIEPYNISPSVQGRADFIESLNPLLTFPDVRATKMQISIFKEQGETYRSFWEGTFTLKPHPFYNFAYYIDPDLKPIELSVGTYGVDHNKPLEEENVTEYFPNSMKASATDNPMVFPVENTYKIGSSAILAMCANTIAVGTGQTGAAPLYVFCADGVYALFVDSSGEMTYTNARALARDVLNNARSVTPIDEGVVFTTDRGLMMIAGEQVQEIGAPAEGDVKQYWNASHSDYVDLANGALKRVAGFPDELCDATDFLSYLNGAIINYNHNERELMVSHPQKEYSYILDRNGNWTRRDYTAEQYVNNYPTSYRVQDGEFYKVDEEGDDSTSLEHKKEADNKFFYLSNVIKLGSIGYKQAYRFVLRGLLNTKWSYEAICYREGHSPVPVTISGNYVEAQARTGVTSNVITFDGRTWRTSSDGGAVSGIGDIYNMSGSRPTPLTDITAGTQIRFSITLCYVGCYVFGSYDGRKWSLLGGNERTGSFTDIGCKIEHTDVRFLRVCLAGQLEGDSRIDYVEMSADASILNSKIR